MDVGKFKASGRRMMAWVVIPPVMIAGIGLSTYAWKQRAEWQLRETQAISDVLPVFITAQKKASDLITDLGINKEGQIGSEDQLISFLQEAALRNNFTVDAIQVVRREKNRGNQVPVLSASVQGSGEFADIQLYVNEIKSAQQLLSVNTMEIQQTFGIDMEEALFEASVVFDLVLIEEVLKSKGGLQ